MTHNATVTPIKHSDVKGNRLLYLKITVADKEVVINIGQKTFDSITQLLDPTVGKTPVQPIEEQIEKNNEQKEKIIEQSIDQLKKKYNKT